MEWILVNGWCAGGGLAREIEMESRGFGCCAGGSLALVVDSLGAIRVLLSPVTTEELHQDRD